MSNLFKEALADAKALREVAEQNAKNAIIEAVTPKIRELIDNQLVGKEVEDIDILEEVSNNILGVTSKDEEEVVLSFEDVEKLSSAINESKSKESNNYVNNETRVIKEQEQKNMSEETYYDVDLDSLLEELSRDAVSQIKSASKYEKNASRDTNDLLNEFKIVLDYGDDADDEKLDMIRDFLNDKTPTVGFEEDAEEDDKLEVGAEGGEDADAGEEGSEEFEIPDLSDLNLDVGASEGEDTKPPVAGEEEASEDKKEDEEEDEEEAVNESYRVNSGKIKRELNKFIGGSKNSQTQNSEGGSKLLREQLRKNRELETQLSKYREVTKTLRDQLNEVNLFNAKLLYVNKLLQNKSLTKDERRNIVESLDRAQSLREAKLLYKSLSESVDRKTKKTLNESKKRTIVGGSSKPTKTGGVLNESIGEVSRWMKLAGLGK